MIDVHSHYVPESLLETMAAQPFAAGMTARREGDVWQVEVTWPTGGGTMRRILPIRPEHRDLKDRLAWMDEQGVRRQVISLLPHLHGWFLPSEAGAAYARAVNDALLAGCRLAPDRLQAMAHLPWQDPTAALAELERAAALGCVAVLVGSRIGNCWLDDPVYTQVLARIAELDLLLFLHPVDITADEGLRDFYLVNLVGNPVDTGIAAARLIFSGALDRHPALRLCLAHGGGVTAFLSGRWEHGHAVRPECKGPALPPLAYLKRLYFDTIVHGDAHLQALRLLVGAERLLVGTDYPADMGDLTPAARLQALAHLDREIIVRAEPIRPAIQTGSKKGEDML